MGELGPTKSSGGPGRIAGSGLGWKPPDLASLSEECLSAAEEAAQKVVNCVRPTLDSEEKRRDIVDYIQRLIKTHLNCEVFSYGSVPLKTYLPDGDIDLTAFKGFNTEKALALGVLAVLQREEKNENAEFQVKDTHFIDAEVKLVKCLVRNTVIDISFNQLGGLATLSFLEQVDRLIGRNHLFKRSIILVKTWCYYESRILGAHHGLISTYALEILVLYIIHLFHSSLSGPLSVLYKFLDYYSLFDWENYCISLKGPVCKSSLPDIVVETPESGSNNLMVSEAFLENCMEMFLFTPRMVGGTPKAFQVKHLNIFDPLKESNNLGRSVNRGNFYRIRSAFKYGARKLGQILLQPRDRVADEISNFFVNTLARHGNDYSSSIQHLAIEFGNEESFSASVYSPIEFYADDNGLLKSPVSDVDRNSIGLESKTELDRYWMSELYLETSSEDYTEGIVASRDPACPRIGTSDFEACSNCNSHLSSDRSCKSSSFASKSSAQIGSLDTGDFCQNNLVHVASCMLGFDTLSCDAKGRMEVNDNYQWCTDNSQAVVSKASSVSSITKANFSDNSSVDFWEVDLKSIGAESESFNPLADLSGDYDCHIRSLLYGQLCHGFSLLSSSADHPPLSSPSQFQSKNPSCDVFSQQHMQFRQCQFDQMRSYPQSLRNRKYPFADSAFHSDGTHKTRGTGSHFQHSNGFAWERPSRGIRNKAPGNRNQSHRYPAPGEPIYVQNENHVVLHARGSSENWEKWVPCSQYPRSDDNGNQTGRCPSGSYKIQFGSIGNLADEMISAHSHDQGSSPGISLEIPSKSEAVKQERAAPVSPIHLTNEAEFPPLS